MMQWNGLGRCDYDDATLLAEYHERPRMDGNAWQGLANALLIELAIGRLAWILWGWMR